MIEPGTPVRLLVVGAGRFAQLAADAFTRVDGVRIVGVCDADAVAASNLAGRLGVASTAFDAPDVQADAVYLAVPPDAMGYSLNHLPIPESLRKNITIATYESGHMMYLLDKDAAKLREDIVGWLK